jgi:hypothetical protein
MKKQLAIMGIIAILVCVGLSGCNEISNTINPEKNKLVGTWKETTVIFVLFSDGTLSMGMLSGTWEIKDGNLVLNYPPTALVFSYAFSNSDRTLTLTPAGGGTPWVLTKQ